MNNCLVLLVAIPFFGAFFSLGDSFRGGRIFSRLAGSVSLLLSILCLVLLLPAAGDGASYAVGGWPRGIGIYLFLDIRAWYISLLVVFVSFGALVFSWGEGIYDYKFTFFYLIMAGGMQGTILTEDVFNLFVFLEIIGVTSYVLIAYSGKGTSLLASYKYLLYSSVGMMFFLFGVFLIYRAAGDLSYGGIRYAAEAGGRTSADIRLGIFILIAGLGIRVALAPFHFWLPDAHAAAPHPVSAVLSGVMLKASLLPLFRLIDIFPGSSFFTLFLWAGAGAALMGALFSLAQRDVKRVLAWSSVSQMGYVFAAYGAASDTAPGAALIHLLNHGITKSLLFLSIGVVIHREGHKKIENLRGRGARYALARAAFLAGTASIMGLPPFGGFAGKKAVSLALADEAPAGALLLLAGVFTAAAFLRLGGIFWTPAPKETPSLRDGSAEYRTAGWMEVSLILLMAALGAAAFSPALSFFPSMEVIYSPRNILEAFLTAALGYGLFRLTRTAPGRALSNRLPRLHPGLNGLLIWGMLGFAGLVLLAAF
jgi:multicomponent Na+:H+ antiporter subunit D